MSFNDNNMASSSKFSKDDDENKIKIENEDFTDSEYDDESEEDSGEHTGLLEEVYQDKLADLKKELRQLKNGTHVEYLKQLKELEQIQKDQLMMNNLRRDLLIESTEREYIRECRLARKEFNDRSNELHETLISGLNEKKKTLENDNLTTEITPDSDDQKPAITRKLRKRPNDHMVLALQIKRRNLPSVPNINYLLHEHEIEQDIKAIQESLVSIPSTSTSATQTVKTRDTVNSSSIRKPGLLQSSDLSSGNMSPEESDNSDTEGSLTIPNIRIEDGKLLFEKIWYHRGQPVFVKGREMAKFPAVISAIGNATIWVKKTLDNSKICIKLSDLSKGRMAIQRRAAV